MRPEHETLAVDLLKRGCGETEVVGHLVAAGAEPEAARAEVTRLVALKTQAEAADRLRAQIVDGLRRGASQPEVVQHLAGQGIDAEALRAEVATLAAAVVAEGPTVPCQACGQAMASHQSFFDPWGRQVCRCCHAGVELAAGAERAYEAERNAAMNRNLAWGALAATSMLGGGVAIVRHERVPERVWCARCRAYGAHWAGGRFVCTKCGEPVG